MAKDEPEKKKKPVRAKPAKTLAILARSRRTGRWRLAKRSKVLALCGTVHLDMRKSFADDDKLSMKVTVLFGSATFILPFGAEVRPSGTSILAASVVNVPEHDDPSELPTLDIEWTAVLGRLRIVTETAVQEDVEEPATTAADEPIGAPIPPVVERPVRADSNPESARVPAVAGVAAVAEVKPAAETSAKKVVRPEAVPEKTPQAVAADTAASLEAIAKTPPAASAEAVAVADTAPNPEADAVAEAV